VRRSMLVDGFLLLALVGVVSQLQAALTLRVRRSDAPGRKKQHARKACEHSNSTVLRVCARAVRCTDCCGRGRKDISRCCHAVVSAAAKGASARSQHNGGVRRKQHLAEIRSMILTAALPCVYHIERMGSPDSDRLRPMPLGQFSRCSARPQVSVPLTSESLSALWGDSVGFAVRGRSAKWTSYQKQNSSISVCGRNSNVNSAHDCVQLELLGASIL
jgi:hypothetical protein